MVMESVVCVTGKENNMTFRGRVTNGVVVLEQGAELPEGTEVRVEPVEQPARQTLYERFKKFAGIAEGLPEDLAEQHDHYIHESPKT
jgi:hypothetical protein